MISDLFLFYFTICQSLMSFTSLLSFFHHFLVLKKIQSWITDLLSKAMDGVSKIRHWSISFCNLVHPWFNIILPTGQCEEQNRWRSGLLSSVCSYFISSLLTTSRTVHEQPCWFSSWSLCLLFYLGWRSRVK